MHEMRRYLDIFNETVAYRDHEVIVLANPSKREVENLAQRAQHEEGLRGIIAEDTLYVWDGYFANHDEIGRKVGVSYEISVHLWTAYVELDALGFEDDEDIARRKAAIVKANRAIQRLYGGVPAVKAELDGGKDIWL